MVVKTDIAGRAPIVQTPEQKETWQKQLAIRKPNRELHVNRSECLEKQTDLRKFYDIMVTYLKVIQQRYRRDKLDNVQAKDTIDTRDIERTLQLGLKQDTSCVTAPLEYLGMIVDNEKIQQRIKPDSDLSSFFFTSLMEAKLSLCEQCEQYPQQPSTDLDWAMPESATKVKSHRLLNAKNAKLIQTVVFSKLFGEILTTFEQHNGTLSSFSFLSVNETVKAAALYKPDWEMMSITRIPEKLMEPDDCIPLLTGFERIGIMREAMAEAATEVAASETNYCQNIVFQMTKPEGKPRNITSLWIMAIGSSAWVVTIFTKRSLSNNEPLNAISGPIVVFTAEKALAIAIEMGHAYMFG